MNILVAITVLFAVLSIVHCDSVDTRALETGPQNEAIVATQTRNVTLQCCVTTPTISTARVEWWEYGTRAGGNRISDGNMTLPFHPNYARYKLLVYNNYKCYNLTINSINVTDGTKYMCIDFYEDAAVRQLGAQLVVINDVPQCKNLIDPGMDAVEGVYYTKECSLTFGAIAPVITWTGPQTYDVVDVTTTNSVTSTVAFYASRTMDNQAFTAKVNFTSTGFGGADMATNTPSYTYTWQSETLRVRWPPQNMQISPNTPTYETDTTITCSCDANPEPIYYWLAVDGPVIGTTWQGPTLFITRNMTGLNSLRCHARNTINGANMSADGYFNVTINPFNPCTSNPCQFGGTCESSGDIYTCRCIAGVTGTNCEIVINYCTSFPCQNGGTCLSSLNSYTCICHPTHTGTHCESPI